MIAKQSTKPAIGVIRNLHMIRKLEIPDRYRQKIFNLNADRLTEAGKRVIHEMYLEEHKESAINNKTVILEF